MNSYEMYIQLDPALEHIIEEISIYLAKEQKRMQSFQNMDQEKILYE